MKSVALQELYDLESTYWWHVGRLAIIENQLALIKKGGKKLRILNVGSGTGGTIPSLEKFGDVKNIDTSTEALRFLASHGYKGQKIQGLHLPFEDSSFDVIAALDVLEHIEKDDGALIEWLRVLKPGGSLLLTVPAYQWLWSAHDEVNNHFRRYNRKQLKHKLERAGFRISKASYAIVFSLPLVVASRTLSKLSKSSGEYSSFVRLPVPINALFIQLLRLEALLQAHINFACGTSLLFVCRKIQADAQ